MSLDDFCKYTLQATHQSGVHVALHVNPHKNVFYFCVIRFMCREQILKVEVTLTVTSLCIPIICICMCIYKYTISCISGKVLNAAKSMLSR